MFQRFTPAARHVVVVAQEEARRRKGTQIEVGDVLLALAAEPGPAAAALTEAGLIAEELRAVVGPGSRKKPADGHIPFSADAKKLLETALREALRLGHSEIAAAHLGLAAVGSDPGRHLLADHLGLDLDALRVALEASAATEASSSDRTRTRTRRAAILAATRGRRGTVSEGPSPQAVLIDALRDPGSTAAKALAEQGVDPGALAERLAIEEESAEVRAARATSIRVEDGAVIVRIADPATVELVGGLVDGEVAGDDPVRRTLLAEVVAATLRAAY